MSRRSYQDFRKPDQDEKIPPFLEEVTCKAIGSNRRRAVILTTNLSVKNALDCLLVNRIRAAVLVDPESNNEFVGMLTISDFINVLRYYHNNPQEDTRDIKRKKIIDLTGITTVIKPVVTVHQDKNLFNAARLLVEEKVHRIIATKDPNKCKFVLSKKRILRHLHNNLFKKDAELIFVRKKIAQLKPALGTWGNIATVTLKTKVAEALDLFCERRVSALPVVDENGKVTDIFAKFDAFIATKCKIHKMEMTVAEALKRVKAKKHEGLFFCIRDEHLLRVVDRFVSFKVHRLVVVNQNNSVIGMISLSDVLKLLSRPRLDNHEIIPDLLRLSICKDIDPQKRNVMTMTSDTMVIYGLEQLARSNIRSAPLCDDGQFIGMLTISDFINAFIHYYNSGKAIGDINDLKVTDLRRLMNMKNEFVAIQSDDSIFNAAELLIQNKIHRIFVIDQLCPFLLTKRRILKYLYDQLTERSKQRSFQKKRIADLKLHLGTWNNVDTLSERYKQRFFQRKRAADLKHHLGTWNNIATVKMKTRVIDALKLFAERKVSSLPVVDKKGKLIDIFSKSDVFAIITDGTYSNRHLSVANALKQGWEKHEELRTCKLDTLLREVIRIFAFEKVHRLVVADSTPSVIGIISTSDILKFLIRMPSGEAQEALEGAVGGSVLG